MSTTITAVTELMDVNDVAKSLRVSPHTVRRWATQGKLHRVKLGSRTLFAADDVARFVDQARNAASESHAESQE